MVDDEGEREKERKERGNLYEVGLVRRLKRDTADRQHTAKNEIDSKKNSKVKIKNN